MAYGIVSKLDEYVMPEHIKGAKLIKYTPGQKPEEYKLKENVKYPGLHLIRRCRKYGIDYLYTPRKLRGRWLLGFFGIKNEAVKPGTSIEKIIQKLELQYKLRKTESVPKEKQFHKKLNTERMNLAFYKD